MSSELAQPRSIHRLRKTKVVEQVIYHEIANLENQIDEVGFIQGEIALEILKSIDSDTFWLHLLLAAYAVDERGKTNLANSFFVPKLEIYQALGLNKQEGLTEREKESRVQAAVDTLNGLKIMITNWQGEASPFWEIGKGFWHLNKEVQNADWSLICQAGQWLEVSPYRKSMYHFSYFASDVFRKLNSSPCMQPDNLWIVLEFASRFNHQQKKTSLSNLEIIGFNEKRKLSLAWDEQKQIIKKTVKIIQSQTRNGYAVDYSYWPEYLQFLFKQEGSWEEKQSVHKKIYPEDWNDFLYCITYFQQPKRAWSTGVKEDFTANSKPDISQWSGKQIRDLREKLNWTQNQLGVYLQVSKDMISKLERGQRKITLCYQEKLNQIKDYVVI